MKNETEARAPVNEGFKVPGTYITFDKHFEVELEHWLAMDMARISRKLGFARVQKRDAEKKAARL